MTTVREASFELFRRAGMTTIFGNPGSTELPMLADFPDDFRYVLALQEAVAVAIADGYAQASGTVAHVNLHTAPGLGNGVGAIYNARANRSPLLVTAGQQIREFITQGANLTNRDATDVPKPFVKYSHEPPRPQDVPQALAQAIHHASLAPRGPAFVSLPMDDWEQEVGEHDFARRIARNVGGRAAPDPELIGQIARRLAAAERPCLVAGPEIDEAGGWDDAIALVEQQRMAVLATPPTGGSRLGFPEDHPAFQGILLPAVGPITEQLRPYDFVLVVGAGVFPYYPNLPGDHLPEGTELVQITADGDEAARGVVGDALVADPALALRALIELTGPADRAAPDPRAPLEEPEQSDPISSVVAAAVLAEVFPDDGVLVLEAPTATTSMRDRLRLGRPGSYYFAAGNGLGYGMPASLGVQLAQPERRVVCVLGEGSAQYAITALWTARAYSLPVTFLVLRNHEYAILKWFATLENVTGAPGLDLPRLDVAATAASYGVQSRTVVGREELRVGLGEALADDGPSLVQVDVAPGMVLA
jgi:benzoylformate decarboxylase